MEKRFKFFGYGIFVLLVVVLGALFVLAAMSAPPGFTFEENTTSNYDGGVFTVNWTNASEPFGNNATHDLHINFSNGTIFQTKVSIANYSFSSTVNANYTFIVEAVNSSDSTDRANSSILWMIVDTINPALSYNSDTETNASGANRNYIFVNVTSSDTNNDSIVYSLYNTTGLVFQNLTDATTLNWTGLPVNVVYTFNVTANDSATNSNTTSTRTFTLDNINPTATAACSDVFAAKDFPCTCTGTDSGSGVSTSVGSSTSSDGITTPLTIGDFTYTCTVTDIAGNSATNTATYSILDSSGSRGGGGGTSEQLPQRKHSFAKITPGAVAIVKNFDSEIGIKEIKIEVNNEAQNVEIIVTKYDGKPAGVSITKSGKVNQYLQIEISNVENKLDKATITARVEKSWISNNGLEIDDVALFKFDESGEEWNELATNYVEADNTYYYYDAEVSSFSFFAIGEKSVVEEDATTGTGTGDEEEGSLVWLWILIVVLVLIAIGWNKKGKKK